MGSMSWSAEDIILAFIREFAGGAENVLGRLTQDQARERIRLAVWRNGRATLPFHDSGLNYLEAYGKAYGISAELRETPRDSAQSDADPEFEDESELDDEEL
jgi:hypothetical protein